MIKIYIILCKKWTQSLLNTYIFNLYNLNFTKKLNLKLNLKLKVNKFFSKNYTCIKNVS